MHGTEHIRHNKLQCSGRVPTAAHAGLGSKSACHAWRPKRALKFSRAHWPWTDTTRILRDTWQLWIRHSANAQAHAGARKLMGWLCIGSITSAATPGSAVQQGALHAATPCLAVTPVYPSHTLPQSHLNRVRQGRVANAPILPSHTLPQPHSSSTPHHSLQVLNAHHVCLGGPAYARALRAPSSSAPAGWPHARRGRGCARRQCSERALQRCVPPCPPPI